MANVLRKLDLSTPRFVILPKDLHKKVSPMAYAVYGAFAGYVNNKTRQTVVKRATIAAELGITLKTVERALSELHKAGYVQTTPRGYKQSSLRTFRLSPKEDDATSEVGNLGCDADSDVATSLDSTENYSLEPGEDPVAETYPDDYAKEEHEPFRGNVPCVTGWINAYRPGGMFHKAS
jgi:DNA-binding MarR family transcriptional regulator